MVTVNNKFNDSKYTTWYYDICDSSKNRTLVGYKERHHIIPRSLGGTNDKSNLADLTAREHFICHWLLTKMCLDKHEQYKMCWALHRLTFANRGKIYTSKEYEVVRKIHSNNLKQNHHSKKDPNWNHKVSKRMQKLWDNTPERKQQASARKKKWYKANKQLGRQISLNNLPKDTKGKNNGNSIVIEYFGKTYYGYEELRRETGCTKDLYKKYYSNGIDPRPRIGKDGPPRSSDIKPLLERRVVE